MNNWQKVFESEIAHRAAIVKDFLFECGITSIIVNKKDSSYNNFGSYEVHVQKDQVLNAIKIINDEIIFE